MTAVVSRFLSGWILERIDDALALVVGNLLLTAALAAYAFSASATAIYVIRAVQGFGWALSTVTVMTMIAENTDKPRVSEAFGYLNVFGSISLLMFPLLGSWIVSIGTPTAFQTCFLLAAATSVVSTALSLYAWKSTPVILRHESPVTGLPDKAIAKPTISVFFLFTTLGVLLSYSPEIASLNGIANPGVFFTAFAFAQVIGSALGGSWTGVSRYGMVATLGAMAVVLGIVPLVLFTGWMTYVVSASTIGLGLATANIALNSYVSAVSTSSEAKGMAVYSAGVDTAVSVGSFGTALLLGFGWSMSSVLSVFACMALVSSVYSFSSIPTGQELSE